MKLKRAFRFSLGTLVLLLTASCAWLGIQVRDANRQALFVNSVKKVDGDVTFKHQVVPGQQDGSFAAYRHLEPGYPRWMRNAVGDDYFQVVDQVFLIDTNVNDEWLANIEFTPDIRVLMFRGTHVTGDGLRSLRWLKKLEVLDLQHRRGLTADNLAALTGLLNLTTLDMTSSPDVSDEGLSIISHLVKLTNLSVSGSRVTDDGLIHLQDMTRMTHLWLGDTGVSDEGLKYLAQMKKLHLLDLRGTRVSDAGLKQLEGMDELWQLVLWDTNVTESAVKELREKLPNLDSVPIGPRPDNTTDGGW